MVEDDGVPWSANDAELIEIRRRRLEEFDRELDQREPGPPNALDPVVAHILGTLVRQTATALALGG